MQSIKLSLIVLIFLISGCAGKEIISVPTVVPVTWFETPTLPPLDAEQKNSIREDVWLILVAREKILLESREAQKVINDKHNN